MKKMMIILLLAAVLPGAATGQNLRKAAKVVSTVSGKITGSDITGTWVYSGTDVKFESDRLLRKAGGAVAASRIESEIDAQLAQIGFLPGVTTFVFEDDGTFENTIGERTVKGTYSLDQDNGTVSLKLLGHVPFPAKVYHSGNTMSLMYETGAFLSVASFVSGQSGLGMLRGVSSILNSYDGMQSGLVFKRL